MNKAELSKDLQNFTGSPWITTREYANYVGYKSLTSARQKLKGLPRFNTRYHVNDVAEMMIGELDVR